MSDLEGCGSDKLPPEPQKGTSVGGHVDSVTQWSTENLQRWGLGFGFRAGVGLR
jgi:hypothetical protein